MHLVTTADKAVPFGLEASAQSNAADIAATLAATPLNPLASAFGAVPVLSVEPFEAPYGPWWVIKVQVGAETRYIADDQPPVFV